jgi:DNA (cytosine-5)-methyltransferase 1
MKKFTFVDLFAGIGGFHGALSAMGGECVYAVEIDPAAAKVYERNWGMNPLGDITKDANQSGVSVPEHDVLCAGFPCQPFSKSGAQRGMDETRGTLFWNILRVIQERQPSVVLLENVRNLAGPRHRHEWQVIVETLRDEGYRVSDAPAVFSPHLLPRELGGRPQVRERVFVTATRIPDPAPEDLLADPVVRPRPVDGWDPMSWQLEKHLPLEPDHVVVGCGLSLSERLWMDAWADFVSVMWEVRQGRRLPGFPIWVDEWRNVRDLRPARLEEEPRWKANFLVKNAEFYSAHKSVLDSWLKRWKVMSSAFPASRRKFEWQAQDTPSLWDAIVQMRPSGIRAKAPTYLPALVAITQTSILGQRERRLSPREAARTQGLPEWFDFGDQPDATTYRQLGNGVSVGAVWHVLKEHVLRDQDVLKGVNPRLRRAVLTSPDSPDEILGRSANVVHVRGDRPDH